MSNKKHMKKSRQSRNERIPRKRTLT